MSRLRDTLLAVRLPRFDRVMIALTLLTVLASPVVAYYSFSFVFQLGRPPAIRYLNTPGPVTTPLCPGDTIRYISRLRIERYPTALTVDRGIWSFTKKYLVVGSDQPITYPYMRLTTLERPNQYTIPLLMDNGQPFPAGQYSLEITASSEGRKTAGFSIPFSLKAPEQCTQPRQGASSLPDK